MGILDSPDPVTFWAARAMLLLAGILGAWFAFDTQRALKMMVALGERMQPQMRRWSINPERAGWIWFYRIDGAVVFFGVVWIFAQHYLAR